jgi:DNA-binding MarR family transcriptional regulator
MEAELSLCRQCHCLVARKRARAITRHFEAYLRPHGLRATQFSILAALTLAGPKRMGELARMLGLERTTLTRIAGLLEGKGWVQSHASGDNRERPLRVTPSGRRKLENAYPSWKEAQDLVPKLFDTPAE